MPVDYSMALTKPQIPNDYVTQIYDHAALLDAGKKYAAGDYTGASQAIGARGDFKTAEGLRTTGTDLQAGNQYASGDISGATQTLAKGGDITGAESLADKQVAMFQKQHAIMQRAVPFLTAAAQQHPDQLGEAFDLIAPSIQEAGLPPDKIAQTRQQFLANPQQTLQAFSAMAQVDPTFEKVGNDIAVFDKNNPTRGPIATFKGEDKAPEGYRSAPDGSLAPIPGGPADPKVQHQRALDNRSVIINNPTAEKSGNQDSGWQLANDPTTNTQYRINVRTGQTVGLDGQPYQPKGAGKISGSTPRSAMAMATQKFIQDNPGASSDDIARFAGNYSRTVQQIGGEAKADSAALTQLTKLGTAASAQEHAMAGALSQVSALMNKGAGTALGPVVNRWLQAGKKATGDPDVAAFNTAVETAAQEYAKIITGSTGATDASRAEAASMMDKFGSPQALLAQLAVIQKDAHFKIQSYADHTDFIKSKLSSGQSGASVPAQPATVGGPAPSNVIRYDQNGNRVQ